MVSIYIYIYMYRNQKMYTVKLKCTFKKMIFEKKVIKFNTTPKDSKRLWVHWSQNVSNAVARILGKLIKLTVPLPVKHLRQELSPSQNHESLVGIIVPAPSFNNMRYQYQHTHKNSLL